MFTVGETIDGYTPPGLLDGFGAVQKDRHTVRVFVNQEMGNTLGFPYTLANGTVLTGTGCHSTP